MGAIGGEIIQHIWSNDAYQWAGVPGNATNGGGNYTANGLNQYTSAAGNALVRRYLHGPGVDEPLVVYEGADKGTNNWTAINSY